MEHRTLKLIRDCAAIAGCELVSAEQTRKHIAVEVAKEGITRRIFTSSTSVNFARAKRIVADMRRAFRK
jgi:hypothetical protein